MTHLNPTEFHAHRTSCLNGAEFPCHETLPPEVYDPIWDDGVRALPPAAHKRARPRKPLQSD